MGRNFTRGGSVQNGEPNIYTAIATLYNGRLQLQWQRVQVLFGFNAIAFPATFIASQPSKIKFLISLIGLVVHVGIFVASRQATRWIAYFEKKLTELEQLDQAEPMSVQRSRITIFSDLEATEINRYPATFAYRWPFGIGIFLWLCLTIWYALDSPMIRKFL